MGGSSSSSLDVFFNPRSIAIVGASADPKKPGYVVLRHAVSMGYKGNLYPVNPRESSVNGLRCYKSVHDVPAPLDLCVLILPAEITIGVAGELAERKKRCGDVRGAICISAGFVETASDQGGERERQLVTALRSASIRLIGPNCLGIMDTASGVNTNFDVPTYPKGGISIVTQSGAFGTSFLMWARAGRLAGLSKFVSLGNMADVQMCEVIAYLKDDASTHVIGVYLEGLSNPREFIRVAREVSCEKPIVVLKAGRSELGAAAALSHTGAVAGSDLIYDGAFRQAGVIRAASVIEFYETLRAFEKQPIPNGNRVCVLTHIGGPGTICVDEFSSSRSLRMANLSDKAKAELYNLLPPAANIGRPDGYIDLTAAHHEKLHNQVLRILFAEPAVDMVIQIVAPSGFIDQKLMAEEISDAFYSQPENRRKPLLNVVMYAQSAPILRRSLEENGLPTLEYPDVVASVANNFVAYSRFRESSSWHSYEGIANQAESDELITMAAREGRNTLTEPEGYSLCSKYNIKVPPFQVVESEQEAIEAARDNVGYPVVLKVVSSEILHKTEAGGVILGIRTDSELVSAYRELLAKVKTSLPHAADMKVLVQQMLASRIELVVGGIRDRLFGPVVMIGLGGIYVEAMRQVGFRLAPLSMVEARDLVLETLPSKLLSPFRGSRGVNVDSVAEVVVSVGRMLLDNKEIEEIDINPLLPLEDAPYAVDARFILKHK